MLVLGLSCAAQCTKIQKIIASTRAVYQPENSVNQPNLSPYLINKPVHHVTLRNHLRKYCTDHFVSL